MNCKEGDLAIFVRSFAGNEGKIVRCVKYLGMRRYASAPVGPFATWQIDRPMPLDTGGQAAIALDMCLRPIRGDDEQNIIERDELVCQTQGAR